MDLQIKEILKEYEIKKNKGKILKNLNKNQRLVLEIIEWCEIPKKYQGFWWRQVKNFPAYTEDRLIELKRKGIKNSAYLKKMIFQ